jgi:IS5 family transposase
MAAPAQRRRQDEVLALTAELAPVAQSSVADARAVLANSRRALRQGRQVRGRAKALVAELDRTISVVERIIVQARSRVDGTMPDGATRVVSLHDTDARPIRKGRLDHPVEFGYKTQIVDSGQGVVVDHQVTMGNPPDAPLLVPAIKRVIALVGRVPRAVTADRGYGEAAVETELTELGVKTVAIPRKGKASPERKKLEHSRSFRHYVKWRTGCEGRISVLKHRYGWARSLLDGEDGTTTWLGLGVLAHNAVKITELTDGRDRRRAPRSRPTGSDSIPRPPPSHPPPDVDGSV